MSHPTQRRARSRGSVAFARCLGNQWQTGRTGAWLAPIGRPRGFTCAAPGREEAAWRDPGQAEGAAGGCARHAAGVPHCALNFTSEFSGLRSFPPHRASSSQAAGGDCWGGGRTKPTRDSGLRCSCLPRGGVPGVPRSPARATPSSLRGSGARSGPLKGRVLSSGGGRGALTTAPGDPAPPLHPGPSPALGASLPRSPRRSPGARSASASRPGCVVRGVEREPDARLGLGAGSAARTASPREIGARHRARPAPRWQTWAARG